MRSFVSFLFDIVVEALNVMIERVLEQNIIKGTKVGNNGVLILHLQFADDTIIFCNNDEVEMSNIKRTRRCFQVVSGLKINYSKSSLSEVNMQHEVVSLAQIMGCKIDHLPIIFGATSRSKPM